MFPLNKSSFMIYSTSTSKILQELEVEVELLKEDNEQLVTQYEREKVNK